MEALTDRIHDFGFLNLSSGNTRSGNGEQDFAAMIMGTSISKKPDVVGMGLLNARCVIVTRQRSLCLICCQRSMGPHYCTNQVSSPQRVTRDKPGEFAGSPKLAVTCDKGDFHRRLNRLFLYSH